MPIVDWVYILGASLPAFPQSRSLNYGGPGRSELVHGAWCMMDQPQNARPFREMTNRGHLEVTKLLDLEIAVASSDKPVDEPLKAVCISLISRAR